MTGKKVLLAGIIALMVNPVAQAASDKHYQEQKDKAAAVGLGTGVVIGAIVAGPVGAGVAGILGAVIGDSKATSEQLKDTQADLMASNAALTESQQQLLAVRDALESAQLQASITQVGLTSYPEEQVMAMESAIQFKSGSDDIEALYSTQLDLIAKALKQHEGLGIRLTGYADYRGEATFNQTLSEQRAGAVKQALTARGVSEDKIALLAVGEAGSQHSSAENTFFDRKVVMQILPAGQAMTAQR